MSATWPARMIVRARTTWRFNTTWQARTTWKVVKNRPRHQPESQPTPSDSVHAKRLSSTHGVTGKFNSRLVIDSNAIEQNSNIAVSTTSRIPLFHEVVLTLTWVLTSLRISARTVSESLGQVSMSFSRSVSTESLRTPTAPHSAPPAFRTRVFTGKFGTLSSPASATEHQRTYDKPSRVLFCQRKMELPRRLPISLVGSVWPIAR
jgi:hypothetical protein